VNKPRASAGAAWTAALIVMAVCLLATFTLATPNSRRDVLAGPAPSFNPTTGLPTTVPNGAATLTPGATQTAGNRVGGRVYDCSKGQNAGATDVGVSANEIRFAATTVESGPAKDFLKDAKFGMLAVANKVNRRGGLCGRQIKIEFRDDSWDPQTGQRFIESFIGDRKYFGLAVNPSSEGLRGAIDSGLIRRAGFPVIGADGMLYDQYTDPWVWPVATSTASVMHIMAANAYARGARTFGIAWETSYRFGKEGHDAFLGTVRRLGGKVNADAPLASGQGSYGNQAQTFISDCGGVNSLNKCDFIAMLLEPATAQSWVASGGLGDGTTRPRIGIGAPQPLFIDSFARNCAKYCSGMWVWTSFKPPLNPYGGDPAVRTYLADLNAVSSSVDASNPHVQGAYVGMLLLVDALTKLGPAPTRAGIKRVLDSTVLNVGLGPVLRFTAGNHFASTTAQAYQAITQNDERGTFQTWRYTNSGFIADREVGRDASG
jgi:ABC-type branched-subunit amino acid transport system substrate-binding protein